MAQAHCLAQALIYNCKLHPRLTAILQRLHLYRVWSAHAHSNQKLIDHHKATHRPSSKYSKLLTTAQCTNPKQIFIHFYYVGFLVCLSLKRLKIHPKIFCTNLTAASNTLNTKIEGGKKQLIVNPPHHLPCLNILGKSEHECYFLNLKGLLSMACCKLRR